MMKILHKTNYFIAQLYLIPEIW